jgi:hypothetical protein
MFIHSQKEIQMMKNVKSIIAVLAMIALIVGYRAARKKARWSAPARKSIRQ